MGRPIQKKWFGLPDDPVTQIVMTGVKFADGTTASNAYIVKQTGSRAYIVQDVGMIHIPEIVFLSNVTSVDDLENGFCFITATPFNGSALPVEKITQFRINLYETDGSIGSYTWGLEPATIDGQATLIVSSTPPPSGDFIAFFNPGVTDSTSIAVNLTPTSVGFGGYTSIIVLGATNSTPTGFANDSTVYTLSTYIRYSTSDPPDGPTVDVTALGSDIQTVGTLISVLNQKFTDASLDEVVSLATIDGQTAIKFAVSVIPTSQEGHNSITITGTLYDQIVILGNGQGGPADQGIPNQYQSYNYNLVINGTPAVQPIPGNTTSTVGELITTLSSIGLTTSIQNGNIVVEPYNMGGVIISLTGSEIFPLISGYTGDNQ